MTIPVIEPAFAGAACDTCFGGCVGDWAWGAGPNGLSRRCGGFETRFCATTTGTVVGVVDTTEASIGIRVADWESGKACATAPTPASQSKAIDKTAVAPGRGFLGGTGESNRRMRVT